MSIVNAITRAYTVLRERNWDTVYWCIDLHGTVLKSNYSSAEIDFIDEDVVNALQMISSLPETRIILWSGIHDSDEQPIRELFASNGIRVDYVNENPEVANTTTGNFDKKFYFSILVDDKAGFDPKEWTAVAHAALYWHARVTEQTSMESSFALYQTMVDTGILAPTQQVIAAQIQRVTNDE